MSIVELENLKEEFLNKFLKDSVEEDVIKSLKKVLKEFKEQLGGDSLQKILSQNLQSHGGGNSLLSSSIGSGNMTSSVSSSSQKVNKTMNSFGGSLSYGMQQSIHESTSEVQTQSNQKIYFIIAACEEIQKLLKHIVQPYVIVNQCIINFESSGKKELQDLVSIIKQEFLNIDKKIVNVLKNYQDVLPIKVNDTLQQLQEYYIQQQDEYINKKLNNLDEIKQIKYVQIQAPFLGYHLVEESKISSLFEKASVQIENLRIQRVGTEFVHHFQKYLTIYIFNKMLMDADIFSGLVVCVKNKKKKTYFFIQYCDVKVEDIEQAYSQDQQIIVNLSKHGIKSSESPQPIRNVNMNSFFQQISASFISMSFESFIPNYGICSETGKIYRHQLSTTNEDRTTHAGIKNPLYFFKDSFMIEKESSLGFQECLNLNKCNMNNFFEALTLLHEFQKTDFKFEFKKGRKLQSLYLSKEHISSLQQIVQEFCKTLVWLEESVFPVNGRVCLLQIMNQIQPLLIEFSNRIMSKSMQEHLGFMKKISIEDFLIKISSKKALKKYIIQSKSFEDSRFKEEMNSASGGESSTAQGQSSSTSKNQGVQQSFQGLGNSQVSQMSTNQGSTSMTSSTYGPSSSQKQQQQQYGSANLQQITSSGIQITFYLMDLNLLNFHKKERKVILKYAAENFLYLPTTLSLENSSEVIKRFNKTWKSTQLWSDNYTFEYNNGEDDAITVQEINKQIAQQYCSVDDDQPNQKNIQMNRPIVSIPKNDFNSYANNSFASPMKKKNQNIHQTPPQNDACMTSNENIGSHVYINNGSEKNIGMEMQQSYLFKKQQNKQSNENKQQFESIFVELLGLLFNVNIMSILTSQTFQNIKFFDEDNPQHLYLMKNYFKFTQVSGDKGYKLCSTLLERSIRLKKYGLACLLIDQGEGKKITKEIIFNYLSEVKQKFSECKQELSQQNKKFAQKGSCDKFDSPIDLDQQNNKNKQDDNNIDSDAERQIKNQKSRDEFDEKLQELVIKHHGQWLNEFNWEKLWRQEFNPFNYRKQNENHSDNNNLLAYTIDYGVRSFPVEIWSQIFDFKKMDQHQFNKLSDNITGDLANEYKIEEEIESADEATPAYQQNVSQKLLLKNFEEQQKHALQKVEQSGQTESNKHSPKLSQSQLSKKSSLSEKSPGNEGKVSQREDQVQNLEDDNLNQKQQEIEKSLNQSQNDGKSITDSKRHSINEPEEGQRNNQNEEISQGQEQIQNQQEQEDVQRSESRKSSKYSQGSQKRESITSQERNQIDIQDKNQQIQDEKNNEEGKLSETKEKSQIVEKQNLQSQQQSRKLIQLNLDEQEERVNMTVRLTPIGSLVSMTEFLQEGSKLCGTLEMKRFSILDEKNYFISNYLQLLENSTNEVRQRKLIIVHCQNLDLLVEENPQYPGLPYAEDTFIRLFSDNDNIKPRCMYVRINDVDYTFTQILHNSQSLQNRVKQGLPCHFEKSSLGERILLSMILNKQYNGLEDEILEVHPTSHKEFRLVNISQSLPFQSSIIRHNSVNYIINVRNILFCMDQMNEVIDPLLFQKYRQINPEKLLDDWLNDLYFYQKRIMQHRIVVNNPRFIIKSSQQQPHEDATQHSQNNKTIFFQKAMIKQLYNRLHRFTKYLKKIHQDDHSNQLPKYQDIFDAISPLLADMYKNVNSKKDTTVVQRFDQIQNNLDKVIQRFDLIQNNLDKIKSFVTCDIPSFYSNFTLEKIYNYESIEEVISTFKSIGPLQSKEMIKQLSKVSRKDNIQWEEIFQNVYKNTQIKTIMINGQLEPDWNEQTTTERFVNQIFNFNLKPVSDYKHQLSNLIFDNCDMISWKMLKVNVHDRITTLSLRGCTKIVDTDVVKISESMPMLTYLDLSKNPNILKFNHTITSKYQQSKPLQFPQLKTLILEENINMVICDIEGQCIQNLNLSSCLQLQYLLTATPNLKRICLNFCPALLEEHAALYIIEGTNCMLDETTSNTGFKQTLSSLTESVHSKLLVYKTYVLSIFGRVFRKVKIIQDIYPLVFALNRRGLNKNTQNKESSFFSFSKKSSSAPDAVIRGCRMSIINLLFKNSNIRELKFMSIYDEFRDNNVSSLLELICEKFKESTNTANRNITDIDTIDLSDIKLNENNMKHLGEIISLMKTTSSQGLSIFIQNTQEPQNQGIKYVCQGALKNDINKIDFTKIKLGAEQIEEICKMVEGVGANNKLSQLFLKHCKIKNEFLDRISKAIKRNQTLRLLDLSDNLFDHEGFSILMQSFYDNTTLTNLVLDGNNLSGSGFSAIKKGRFLKKLNIQHCWLEEQDIVHLCQLLQQEEQLNYLDLSYNKVNIKSTLSLITAIKKSNCLKEIVFKKIFFDEEESVQNASRISEIISNNPVLQTLDLSGNSIGSDGLINFGRALAQNTALRVLIINDDHTFGLRGVANLADLIQANNTLQTLEILGIEKNQESKLEGFQAAWEIVKQKLQRNNLVRLSKGSNKKQNLNFLYQKKGNTSPTHRSLDQSSFYIGGEKLDSSRIKGSTDHYRLGLSIDGGGMRGIIPGCMIQYLCQHTKREVHEIFDVVGGTSIGGILALALVSSLDGKTPVARGVDLPSFFEENGPMIFNSSKYIALWNNLRDKSKYDPAGIESILKRYFGNIKLSDVIKGTNVITTAMKRENIQGKNMAKIFRSKEAMFSVEKNFYMRDIARATSAAPTYFPSAEIKNINGTKSYSLIDGALGQNNPSKLVLDDIKTEALNSGNEKNFFLLSLSTGTTITTQQISQNAGIFNLVPIIQSLGEGALAFLDKDIEKSADGQYLRINPGIPVKKHEAELDNTDPKILDVYKQVGYQQAEKFIMQDLKYGPFHDQNLIDWFAENTAKKKDTYI